MDDIGRLLDLLVRVHGGDAWHGPSVMEAVKDIDADQARARPIADAHSIWEITLHVIAWRQEVEARLQGKTPSLPADGDWPEPPSGGAEAWSATLARLQGSHESLADAVRQLDAAALDRPVGGPREPGLGTGVTVRGMLDGIVHHDAYHAGQISLLKKMRGHRRG